MLPLAVPADPTAVALGEFVDSAGLARSIAHIEFLRSKQFAIVNSCGITREARNVSNPAAVASEGVHGVTLSRRVTQVNLKIMVAFAHRVVILSLRPGPPEGVPVGRRNNGFDKGTCVLTSP